MKIAIIVEGQTEKAFLPKLREFLGTRLAGRMPRLDTNPCRGRVPKADKLSRLVNHHLRDGADAVIALTDVYTGTRDFTDAADARAKMKQWVGDNPKFHPHAAQYDFEAWLLPFWDTLARMANSNWTAPSGNPEAVNHEHPPAHRINDMFEAKKQRYVKPRDAMRVLEKHDLLESADKCSELKAFLNTILTLCGGEPIP